MQPLKVSILLNPPKKVSQLEDNGEEQVVDTEAIMPNWPVISPGDILVTRYNKRFRVSEVSLSEIQEGLNTQQQLKLHYLNPVDAEYSLPVDIGMFDAW